MKELIVNEHTSTSYAPRTYDNASRGVTLAIATDFTTAGEKLTHKASKGKIVQIPYGEDTIVAARKLYSMLKKYDCHIVNVAGNGIYTLKKKRKLETHRRLTQYADDTKNWITCCKECFAQDNDHYKAMWKDYYESQGFGESYY